MTNQSHTELAALVKASKALLERYRVMGCGDGIEARNVELALAALESPERVQGEAPDTPEMKAVGAFLAAAFDSKMDGSRMREAMLWSLGRTSKYEEAIVRKHPMNDLRNPLGKAFWELTQQVEALGASPALTDVVIAIGALRDQVGSVINPTPSPQAEKQPLSEADEALMRQAADALEQLVDEKADYMIRNKLGNPYAEHATKQGIAAITALRARLETSNV